MIRSFALPAVAVALFASSADAATIVDSDGQGFDRLVVRARRRYAAAYGAAAPEAAVHGPLAERVRAMAERALA